MEVTRAMTKRNLDKGTVLKEAYPWKCWNDGYEQMANPSILMEMGINSGMGNCLNCGARCHLTIAADNEHMESENLDTYMERFKAEQREKTIQ